MGGGGGLFKGKGLSFVLIADFVYECESAAFCSIAALVMSGNRQSNAWPDS